MQLFRAGDGQIDLGRDLETECFGNLCEIKAVDIENVF